MPQALNSGSPKGYQAVEEDVVYEEDWQLSSTTKKWLIAVGVAVSVVMLWFFCFFLPSTFVPTAHDLVGLDKVQSLAIELVPVSPEVVASWGYKDTEEGWEDEEEEEEETSEDDEESLIASSKKPKSKKPEAKQRLIMVGDIHGQEDEFLRLLRKIKYDKKSDALLVLGDFISKGPRSLEVVDDLIDLGAKCILGNHEYYVLQNYARFHNLDQPFFVGSNATSQGVSPAGFDNDPEFLLAKKLQPRHVEYINSCPMIMDLGAVPLHSKKNNGKRATGHGLAVHAGLRWDVSRLEDQDPNDCLEMRAYLKPHYNETTSDPHADDAFAWYKYWNQLHKNGTDDDYVVYYGHDAGRGLNLRRWSKGLDNGCVGGNKLAAMVIWQETDKKGRVLHKEQVVQVKC